MYSSSVAGCCNCLAVRKAPALWDTGSMADAEKQENSSSKSWQKQHPHNLHFKRQQGTNGSPKESPIHDKHAGIAITHQLAAQPTWQWNKVCRAKNSAGEASKGNNWVIHCHDGCAASWCVIAIPACLSWMGLINSTMLQSSWALQELLHMFCILPLHYAQQMTSGLQWFFFTMTGVFLFLCVVFYSVFLLSICCGHQRGINPAQNSAKSKHILWYWG